MGSHFDLRMHEIVILRIRLTHNNVSLTVNRHFLSVYYLNNDITISTDEGPSLRIETFAIIDLREVSTKLNEYYSKLLSV